MEYLIGVDLGTTSTKIVAFDKAGKAYQQANHGYQLYRSADGMAEEDPEEIFLAFKAGMKEVIHKLKTNDDDVKILAVAFSSAMHSLIAFDEDWKTLTRVITWADTRSVNYANELKAKDLGHEIYAKTGTPIHPMAPLSKLMWLKAEKQEIFAQAKHYLGIKEYIFRKLFKSNKMDLSMASGTGMFNLFEKQWDKDVLKMLDITEEQLPEVVDVYSMENQMDPYLAIEMDLAVNTPFVYGAGDGPLSNLGLNAIKPGVAAITIGTSGAIRTVSDKPVIDNKARTFTYAIDENHWVVGGPVNNGGDVLRWVKETLFSEVKQTAKLLKQNEYSMLTDIAAQVPAGANGLIFHPYLGGERAPIWDANARGSYFGLTYNHNKADMLRAALEGIIYNIYSVGLALTEVVGPIKEIQATGGFAKSATWSQILADVFESTINIPEDVESGCLAATVMAQKALGLIDSIEDIEKILGPVKEFKPNENNFEVYREIMGIYLNLTKLFSEDYQRIAEFQRKHELND